MPFAPALVDFVQLDFKASAADDGVILVRAVVAPPHRDAALNGEDPYSADGQMDYLRRYGQEFPGILLAVNLDDVGFKQGRTSYSYYECAQKIEEKVENLFRHFDGLVRGAPWFNGDHMIFVQNQVPAVAFTSECLPELMRTITHTPSDSPDIIDCQKLVELAASLNALIRSF